MKISANKSDENMEVQTGPKLRNIHEEKEAPEEKPKGADVRLKIAVVAVLALVLFVGIKGYFTKMSLISDIESQQKKLEEVQAKASDYGITVDEEGNIIAPDIEINAASTNVSSTANAASEQDAKVLDDFTKMLLNWKGQSGYNKARQTLIDDWGFNENCKLLTSFMPAIDEELDANMSLSGYATFKLSEEEGNTTYFLICTVRNTIDGTSATGTVGIQIKINSEGSITNVTAQTIS